MALSRRIFWFVLRYFEQGEGSYSYKPMHRKILLVVGLLFGGLSGVSFYLVPAGAGPAALVPAFVFSAVALVCLVVGLLGSDRAVARIWGQDKPGRQ